jgi:hypothetical protein
MIGTGDKLLVRFPDFSSCSNPSAAGEVGQAVTLYVRLYRLCGNFDSAF